MGNYKEVKDLTWDINKVACKLYGFPKDITITDAKLIVDEWGTYYVDIEYILDGLSFYVTERVYNNLSGAVSYALSRIVSFYKRVHQMNEING